MPPTTKWGQHHQYHHHRRSFFFLFFPLFFLLILTYTQQVTSWSLKEVADTVGTFLESTFQPSQTQTQTQGQAMMGNAGGKPFGEEAKKILSKPASCTDKGETEKETGTFAAGCFWSVELSFQRVPGVLSTRVGYIGGATPSPTYKQVCTGTTGHAEAVEVVFDPRIVTYPELLTVLWDRHDPTTKDRQGNDVGTQYRSAIFYHSESQKQAAEASIKEEQKRRMAPIVTQVVPATVFYPAEDYHQRYLEKGGQCARTGDTSAIRCYG